MVQYHIVVNTQAEEISLITIAQVAKLLNTNCRNICIHYGIKN